MLKRNYKDLALVILVLAGLAGLFALLLHFRHSYWLLALFALAIYPNVPAFIDGAPFVPTPMEAAARMAAVAGLKPGDTVYDLGCGDGRVVWLAVRDYGAKGTGYELSPLVWLLAQARRLLWRSGAGIRFGDFRRANLSAADAVFCYLLPDSLAKLEPKLGAELKKGARVVLYRFPLPGWRPKARVDGPAGTQPVWLYEKE